MRVYKWTIDEHLLIQGIMQYNPINIEHKLSSFPDHWSPKIIAGLNDYHLKLVKFQGEFVWHQHRETDEVFMILNGKMAIYFRGGSAHLGPGEMFVVPKGKGQKTAADRECQVLIIEPAGTINIGDSGGQNSGTARE